MTKIIKTEQIFQRKFNIYGTFENPLFLAKDIAELIDYDQSSIHKMVLLVDEDEKVRNIIPTLGGNQEAWFLTEDGLYEVLMQSRKAIAKEFKREVKKILKNIRKQGSYINSEHDNLSPEVKALISHDIEIKRLDKKIEDTRKEIEDNLPLFQVDCVLLSNCVKRKGVQILGGKETEAYKDKSIRGKVYSDIYMQIKREFGLVHNNRFLPYNALLRKYRDDAMELVENYETPLAISEDIYMQIKREFGLVHNNRFLPYNALLRKYRDDAMELVENYETPLAISEKILELNGVSV